jgi:hypothetical protein
MIHSNFCHIIVINLLIIVSNSGYAQTSEFNLNITAAPASPDVASLMKFNITPVNLFTGIPSIDVPLFTANGKNINQNISLSYHAGGIKVEEVASSVGLGWSLNSGGLISRQVRGIPDDTPGTGYINSSVKPSDFLAITDGYEMISQMIEVLNKSLDLEPDIFIYNFAGYSGEFFFNEQGEIHFKEHKDLIIEYLSQSSGIGGWIIKTPEGNSYYFGESSDGLRSLKEIATITNRASSDQNLSPYTSTWFLAEVVNYNSNENIEYFYKHQISKICIRSAETRVWLFGCKDTENFPTYSPVTYTKSVNSTKVIDSIHSKFNSIKFEYLTRRDDLPGTNSLDKITLFNDLGEVQSSFDFSYGYFVSSELDLGAIPFTTVDERTKRLKLLSIQQSNAKGTSLPPYFFSYNEEILLPERFSKSIDYWGFYNGVTNSTLIPTVQLFSPYTINFSGANRIPDHEKMKAGILTRIDYPTGGSVSYEFEGNIANPSPTYKFPNIYEDGLVNIIDINQSLYNENFTINNNGYPGAFVDFQYVDLPTCTPNTRDCGLSFEIIGISDPSFYRHYYTFQGQIYLDNGDYLLKVIKRNYPFNFDRFQLSWTEVASENEALIFAGGLRIKRIRLNDGQKDIKDIHYEYNLFTDSTRSSGFLTSSPIFGSFNKLDKSWDCITCSLYTRTSLSNYPLATSKGGYVGYINVSESEGGSGENGKVNYYFSFDYDDDNLSTSWPFSPADTYDWTRGNLLKSEFYDATGQILKRNEKQYTYERNTGDPHRESILAVKIAKAGTGACFEQYSISGEWYHLDSQIETSFNKNNELFVKQTDLIYGEPLLHIQPTEIIQYASDGQEIKTIKNYPFTPQSSFLFPLSANDLTAKNKLELEGINIPALEEVVLLGETNQYLTIKKTFKRYSEFNEGKQRLSELHESYGESEYVVKLSVDSYDSDGNVVEFTTLKGDNNVFIWSKDKRYQIAKVLNAQRNEVYFTSFEETGTLGLVPGDTRSGGKYFNGASYTIPATEQPSGTNLKMTYWFYSSGTWNFQNEVDYTATITKSGATRLDDIRIFPVGAHMITYSYDRGVGITSISDSNEIITKYIYDDFGRLIELRDHKNNLLEKTEYHYYNEN